MRYGAAAILAAVLSAPGWAQEDKKDEGRKDAGAGVDKFGKMKAPEAMKKILAENAKRKGCAIKETSSVIRGTNKNDTAFEGILRKEFCAVKGGAEVYAKAKDILVNVGGRFDPPDKLQEQDGAASDNFRNPALILADASKASGSAAWANDEAVEGKDCRVIDILADEVLLRQLLKEFGERLTQAAERRSQGQQGGRGGLGGFGRGGMMQLNGDSFDPKTSVSTFKLWVGKEDLNIYRMEWYLTPKLKANAIPKEFQARVGNLEFQTKIDVVCTKWDEEIAYDIPAVIKAKWAIK